jgi:hypothetical protein
MPPTASSSAAAAPDRLSEATTTPHVVEVYTSFNY